MSVGAEGPLDVIMKGRSSIYGVSLVMNLHASGTNTNSGNSNIKVETEVFSIAAWQGKMSGSRCTLPQPPIPMKTCCARA